MYFSGMETLICHEEIESDRVSFLRFCTKYVTRFSKYRIELIVAMSSTNATKPQIRLFHSYVMEKRLDLSNGEYPRSD